MDKKTIAIINENQPMKNPIMETLTTDTNLTIVSCHRPY